MYMYMYIHVRINVVVYIDVQKLNVKTYVHEFLYIGKVFCQKCFQYQSINLKRMLCVCVCVCVCEEWSRWGYILFTRKYIHPYQSRAVVTREILLTDLYQYPERFLEREREKKEKGGGEGWRGNEYYIWFFHHPWLTSAVICMSRVAATGAMACAENHDKDDVKYIL